MSSTVRRTNHPRHYEMGLLDDHSERYTDIHFRTLYKYHQHSGWQNMVIASVCKLFTTLFTILFSMFMISCVSWDKIWSHSVVHFHDALYDTCMPKTLWIKCMYSVFIVLWLSHFGDTISRLSQSNEMNYIWEQKLSSLGKDLKWVPWNRVTMTYRLSDEHLRIYENIDDYIIGKIMRYDNYLIAMINMNIFGFDSSFFTFTRFVELNLWWAFRFAFFSVESGLPRDFLHSMNHSVYTRRLRIAFTMVGVFNLFMVVFASIASFVFFVYKNIGLYHRDPTRIGAFQFTPLAKWKLRDFNELPHVFCERLESAHKPVKEYLGEFGEDRFNPCLKLGEFVLASVFSVLIVLSLMNPTLMISEGWSVLFTMGVTGAILMFCQGVIRDAKHRPDPDQRFDKLVNELHYTPMSWESLSTRAKYNEIRTLFRLRLLVFFQEFMSLITCPFLFMFWLPKRADGIVLFLRDHSRYVPGRGVLCSFAVFDTRSAPSSESLISEASNDVNHSVHSDNWGGCPSSSMTLKYNHSLSQLRRHYTLYDSRQNLTPQSHTSRPFHVDIGVGDDDENDNDDEEVQLEDSLA